MLLGSDGQITDQIILEKDLIFMPNHKLNLKSHPQIMNHFPQIKSQITF